MLSVVGFGSTPRVQVPQYVGHFLQNGQRYSAFTIDCPNDGTAMLKAEDLLAGGQFSAMDLFREGRVVARVTIGSPAHLLKPLAQ